MNQIEITKLERFLSIHIGELQSRVNNPKWESKQSLSEAKGALDAYQRTLEVVRVIQERATETIG